MSNGVLTIKYFRFGTVISTGPAQTSLGDKINGISKILV